MEILKAFDHPVARKTIQVATFASALVAAIGHNAQPAISQLTSQEASRYTSWIRKQQQIEWKRIDNATYALSSLNLRQGNKPSIGYVNWENHVNHYTVAVGTEHPNQIKIVGWKKWVDSQHPGQKYNVYFDKIGWTSPIQTMSNGKTYNVSLTTFDTKHLQYVKSFSSPKATAR